MKLEIRKATMPDGGVFYQIFLDNSIRKSFWIGNNLTGEIATYPQGTGEEAALDAAKDYYGRLKSHAISEPIVEIIQSETI